MSSRWTGFFIWALVAACVAFWGLKIFAATHPVPAGAQVPQPPVAVAGPMVRLFGELPKADESDNAPSPTSDRFQLVGVIAPREGSADRSGIAIVSVDNQPAKAWHVGSELESGTTLLAVARRTAEFGPEGGPAAFKLELPEPQAAQTGTLPQAVSQPDGPAPTPRPMTQPGVNPQMRPNMPFQGARPGMPPNPNIRMGTLPGQATPAQQVPPVRTPATPGQAPQPPQGDTTRDEE